MTEIGEVIFTQRRNGFPDWSYTATIWKTKRGYMAGIKGKKNIIHKIRFELLVKIQMGTYESWSIDSNTVPEEDWNKILAQATAEAI